MTEQATGGQNPLAPEEKRTEVTIKTIEDLRGDIAVRDRQIALLKELIAKSNEVATAPAKEVPGLNR